jgi:cysteine desulfurase/selenocysteine lyase
MMGRVHDRPAKLRLPGEATHPFDIEAVRRDFPILSAEMNGRPLVYLDNAATTQKPRAVIDAIVRYYEAGNANIHRGVYTLSQQSTAEFDRAREVVARFLSARATGRGDAETGAQGIRGAIDVPAFGHGSPAADGVRPVAPEPLEAAECIFVRGVTEAINLVAMSWGRVFLKPGDEVLLTALEHHSNIVPWQLACEATGAKLRRLPMDERGELEYDRLGEFITPKTRLVAIQHVSNALGTVHDVARITAAAKEATGGKALVLIDGAQHVGHFPTDVRAIGCDFYCFSGHKLFGPTGIGVLWGRREVLEQMPPFHGGGDMIESVTWEKTTYAPIPAKFEAGTPDIAGAIGLGAAIEYLESLGWEKLVPYEEALLAYATKRLAEVPGLRIIGTAGRKAGVISFVVGGEPRPREGEPPGEPSAQRTTVPDGSARQEPRPPERSVPPIAPLDIGTKLDAMGIAVRTGHHCAQPLMDEFGIPGTTRASFAFYNTRAEVDALVEGLMQIVDEAQQRQSASPSPATEVAGHDGHDRSFAWPDPGGASPEEAAHELIETFALLTEAGEDPRDHVLELGRKLLPLPESERNDATYVRGCMSQVWLTARKRPGTADAVDFLAESDAEIVKGLIAVLQHVFSGQSAKAILDFDIHGLLRKLNFQNLISVQRRSGVEAMINRIRTVARAMADESGHE